MPDTAIERAEALARALYAADPVIQYRGDTKRTVPFDEAAGDDTLGAVARAREFAAIATLRAEPLRVALEKAESFIRGFEDDELQEGIDELLADVRGALA